MRLVATSIALVLIAGAAPASASGGWTFCVAVAPGGQEVWISEVFAAPRAREKLEADFANYLRGRGVAGADAQCPRPEGDKTAAVNAQFTAAEFNRKLGRALREVAASEFPPRR
jgi:hypothetical protein